MRFLMPVIFSIVALGSTSVSAQGYSDEYNKCLNTSYGQIETVKKCVDKELKSQEKKLKKHYENYLKNSGDNQSYVEQQHKIWQNRVNQQCYLKVTTSLLKVKQNKCILEMTMERAYYYQMR